MAEQISLKAVTYRACGNCRRLAPRTLLLFLALLGAIGAAAEGAEIWRATLRVTFWGALAMALTAGIGVIAGTAV